MYEKEDSWTSREDSWRSFHVSCNSSTSGDGWPQGSLVVAVNMTRRRVEVAKRWASWCFAERCLQISNRRKRKKKNRMYRGITTASASFHVCVVDTGHKYDLAESWVDVGGGHFGPHFKNLINKNRLGFNYLSF